MKRTALILFLLAAAGGAAALAWWLTHRERAPTELVLYGNVDLRQVQLAFNNNERIVAVTVQEGDRVRAGQVLGRLDTSRLEPQVAQAAYDVAAAKLAVSRKALDLAVAGPRKEEVDEAEARWRAAEAQLALLRQQLADAQLLAPADAVVRTRLLEPGEMSTPMRPVFSLAITDPKWVRAYVSEPDLGRVREGMAASVTVDSFPGRSFDGWVGFISPVAEFTPKPVQTEELRASLVYEVRVFVKDPSDDLRLGMPATVRLPLGKEEP